MKKTGRERTSIIYQGPPRNDGLGWVNGDRFYLSGLRPYQAREGVELAKTLTGIGRETNEYRYDTAADMHTARYAGEIPNRRQIGAAVNIFGKDTREFVENWQRWNRNHFQKDPGKLWFITPGSEPRYLLARASAEAGTGAMDVDPTMISRLDKFDWGWVSDSPYYFGMQSDTELGVVTPGRRYSSKIYNPSTASVAYPVIYVSGAGSWTVKFRPRANEAESEVTINVPTLTADEEARIDFSPANPTFLKRNVKTGKVTNLWPFLTGKRPKAWLYPETVFSVWTEKSASPTGPPSRLPRVEFTPLFSSWI